MVWAGFRIAANLLETERQYLTALSLLTVLLAGIPASTDPAQGDMREFCFQKGARLA